MAFIRTEDEANQLIEEMMKKGKGKYITQSVVFNKQNPRHIGLLRRVLMSSESFGGFVREVLAEKFSDECYIIIDKRDEDKNTDYFIEI